MKKNKAIIFDMGGVLVDLDLEACKKAFKDGLCYERIDEILDACHQKGIFGEMEEGKLSADEFRMAVLAESRRDAVPSDVDAALAKILVGIEPYKLELLHKLAEVYDIYMLSNNNPIVVPIASRMFAEGGFSMESDFRKCYFSYKMKALKPSLAFYKAVMEDVGLPLENMLFIDDSQLNVDGAIASGLRSVYYKPGSDLAALLAEVLGDDTLRQGGAGC